MLCWQFKDAIETNSFTANDATGYQESVYHTQLRTIYVKIAEGSTPRTGDAIMAVCVRAVSTNMDLELVALTFWSRNFTFKF